MALPNSNMNAVLRLSSGIFGRRAETAFKTSPHVACFAEREETLNIDGSNIAVTIRDIKTRLTGQHFRESDDTVFFVLEFDLRATLLYELGGPQENNLSTAGRLLLRINAEPDPASASGLGLLLFFSYEGFELDLALGNLGQELGTELGTTVESLLGEAIPIPLHEFLGRQMTLVGSPEITTVARGTANAALALGLEISPGTAVDRNHFRTSYNEGLPNNEDWELQIEGELMHQLMGERFGDLDMRTVIGPLLPENMWLRGTPERKACWSGRCLDWDYRGWKDYVGEHYRQHPVWLAAFPNLRMEIDLGLFGSYDVDVPLYWMAWADLVVDQESGELVLDPYIFELDARNWIGFTLPAISTDIAPQRIPSARFGDDLIMRRTEFSPQHFGVSGNDLETGLSGQPVISYPNDVGAYYSQGMRAQETGGMVCMVPVAFGELEGAAVLGHFTITNQGEAPLWVCSVTIEGDDGNVFRLRLPEPTPFRIDAHGEVQADVLMEVPEGDNSIHEASLVITSNDFADPRASIPLRGQKTADVGGEPELQKCFFMPSGFTEQMAQEIYELVVEAVKEELLEKIQRDYPVGGWEPEPEPSPCPTGYFLDVAVSTLAGGVVFDILDSRGRLIDHAGTIGTISFFSVPLPPAETARIEMKPKIVEAGGAIKLGLSRVFLVSLFKSPDPVSFVTAERDFVYAAGPTGVTAVNAADPKNPKPIATIQMKGISAIGVREGYLYLLTDTALEVIDVNDPYNPTSRHSVTVSGHGSLLMRGRDLVVCDGESLRVYDTRADGTPRWQREFRPGTRIEKSFITHQGFVLIVRGGAYRLRSFERRDFEKAALEHVKAKDLELSERFSRKVLLRNDYLVSGLSDQKGFAILRKESIPYVLADETVKGIQAILQCGLARRADRR